MQIGVGLSLPLLATRRSGGFSPLQLFTGGVQGAWYDPSDYSTLFQDSAGTTPVTAVEQPVGLMLDKSQGLVLGSDTGTDFSSASGWTLGSGISISGGALNFTSVTAGANAQRTGGTLYTAGTTRLVTVVVNSISGGTINVTVANASFAISSAGTFTARLLGTANNYLTFVAATGTVTAVIDSVTVQDLAGNHASQATAASRPVLRARYNLLTYSEQFDNAAWTVVGGNLLAFGSGSVANATAAPDGTTTADLIVPNTTLGLHSIWQTAVTTVSGASYTASWYVKPNGYTKIAIVENQITGYETAYDATGAGSVLRQANATGTITALANGWYRITHTSVAGASFRPQLFVLPPSYTSGPVIAATWTPNGTDGVYIWGADLRTGSSAGTYQRIAAATDYATAGFLPYLAFDGSDDSFSTGSINFSATDKMSVCAGVTKLSDAAVGVIAELSTSAGGGTSGTFVLHTQTSPVGYRYAAGSGFSGAAFATDDASIFTAPITNVVTGISNFAGATINDEISVRVNGATPTQSIAGTVSTGNFGNYPLYIGRRSGASLPFNGRIYQLVVCGKALSASELASTEAYVNQKTGAF